MFSDSKVCSTFLLAGSSTLAISLQISEFATFKYFVSSFVQIKLFLQILEVLGFLFNFMNNIL